jgi:hypothetical protein
MYNRMKSQEMIKTIQAPKSDFLPSKNGAHMYKQVWTNLLDGELNRNTSLLASSTSSFHPPRAHLSPSFPRFLEQRSKLQIPSRLR